MTEDSAVVRETEDEGKSIGKYCTSNMNTASVEEL